MSCKGKDRVLAEAYGTGMYSMEAIAEHFGVSRMTVSQGLPAAFRSG
jgi:DNA-binding GntR family transcriptional regulator